MEAVKNDGQFKKKMLKLWARTCCSSSTPAELTERFAALVAEPEFHKGEESDDTSRSNIPLLCH
jgi:hypothetical protein